MERLGIPAEAADTAVKNNIIRLINSASAWIETITGGNLEKLNTPNGMRLPERRNLFCGNTPSAASGMYGIPLTVLTYSPTATILHLPERSGCCTAMKAGRFAAMLGAFHTITQHPAGILRSDIQPGIFFPKTQHQTSRLTSQQT